MSGATARDARLLQQPRGLEQRQAHDAGVAAFDAFDEHGGKALDAVAAGLVIGLRGRAVALDLFVVEFAECHGGHRGGVQQRALDGQCNGGANLVRAAGEPAHEGGGFVRVGRLGQHFAIDDHHRIGRQYGTEDHRAHAQHLEAEAGFLACGALDIVGRRFIAMLGLVDIGSARGGQAQQQRIELHADLLQQFASSRAA